VKLASPPAILPMRGFAPRRALGILLFLAFLVPSVAQDAPQLRRGSYAAFVSATEILDAAGAVLRTSTEGEVVRIRKIEAEKAEVTSDRPELVGGLVPLSALAASTSEANTAWVSTGAREAGLVDQQLAGLKAEPPAKDEAALEAAEAKADSVVASPLAPAAKPVSFREPVIGWFVPGAAAELTGVARSLDGSTLLTGTAHPPIKMPGARAWSGELPAAEASDSPALPFVARIAPDLKSIELVVFRTDEIAGLKSLRASPDGSLWVVASKVGESLAGADGSKASSCLLRFSPDLRSITRCMALVADVREVCFDSCGRPVGLTGSQRRSGGGFLTRYFSEGRFERMWPQAPDGPSRHLKLDFSSPTLAGGPFALWAKKSEVYPDFPTPFGDWGAAPNAGQPVVWTNAKGGSNPIRKADLKPEALTIDRDGNLLVSGTIPFEMPLPDFDPFLMSFSPEGKLRWTNCFLTGLLSEPDQKTQALAIDPTNGDILACYWQHGNNRQTFLLDPHGWLNKFTGTNSNIKITWIGRVDPTSGKLKNSTYIYSQMPNSKNPRWPDLNSVTAKAMGVDSGGRVYVCGGTTISFPTTSNAYLPSVSEFGGHPFFAVLKPDLSGPHYSTYLSPGQGDVDHLAILPGGAALLVGTHQAEGVALPVTNTGTVPFLSKIPPPGEKKGVFIAILPVPAEDAAWKFGQ
jgi:hypothetical protein